MGSKDIQKKSSTEEKIKFVNQQFRIKDTVDQLHTMMKNVTKNEMSAKTVNAACNCVSQLNQTIDMVIKATKFMNDSES